MLSVRGQIITIVKSRRSQPSGFAPWGLKNGARSAIRRAVGGSWQWESTDVNAGSLAACDLGPSAPRTAKMALLTLEKRHFSPISMSFLTIFSGFFCELAQEGANWRECDPEKRWS
jgi:hypothetical protein